MVLQTFDTGTLATTTTLPDVADWRMFQYSEGVVRNSVTTNLVNPDITHYGVTRGAVISSSVSGSLKYQIRLDGVMSSSVDGSVTAFLRTEPEARPSGKLYIATLEQLLDPEIEPPAFAGQRFPKGDLFPVGFRIWGERLEGLVAHLACARVDSPTSLLLSKTSPTTITLTTPIFDATKNANMVCGYFNLLTTDTLSLPEVETEILYRFWLDDGVGRVFQVEQDSFFVYPVIPLS